MAVTTGHRASSTMTVTTSKRALLVENPRRVTAFIQNQGSVMVYLGKSSVAVRDGFVLGPGSSFVDDVSIDEWWAVAASDSATVHCIEVT